MKTFNILVVFPTDTEPEATEAAYEPEAEAAHHEPAVTYDEPEAAADAQVYEPAAEDAAAEGDDAAPREIQILETAEDIQGRREQVLVKC